AGWPHGRRAGLCEDLVLGAQRAEGSDQAVEGPGAHVYGDQDARHQYSSPMRTARGRVLTRDDRWTRTAAVSRLHILFAHLAVLMILNVSSHSAGIRSTWAARNTSTAMLVFAEMITSGCSRRSIRRLRSAVLSALSGRLANCS